MRRWEENGWYFEVRPLGEGRNMLPGFIAFAKREPFITHPCDGLRESGDLWFEWGTTADEAEQKLRAGLPRI